MFVFVFDLMLSNYFKLLTPNEELRTDLCESHESKCQNKSRNQQEKLKHCIEIK